METNVDQPAAEREPDHVTPPASSYSGAVLDAIATTLAAERDLLAGQRLIEQPEPERRTVSLEVLTDEVLDAAEAGQAGVGELFGGKVGIVMRLNGAIVDVPELDTLWAAPYRRPADVLAVLLRQARMYADGLHGNTGAELLMPTPDVLAALAGTTAATWWTVPVEVRADQVQPGWLVVDLATEGSAERVKGVVECEDDTCTWNSLGSDCHVVLAKGVEPVHFAAWQPMQVRIPAAQAVAR